MAAIISEVFYLTRDNTVDLILKSDGVVTNLASVTKVEVLDTGCKWSVDSEGSPEAFTIGGADGSLILAFGNEPIPAGTYKCRIIVYDPTNIEGVVWGEVKLIFRASCSVAQPGV